MAAPSRALLALVALTLAAALPACWPARPPLTTFTEVCGNGADDDGDDLIDCEDPDCAAACNGSSDGQTEGNCQDGLDDDGDGDVDCDDSDCLVECGEGREVDCADGLDDDSDGFTDCADDDCFATESCL